jgi:ankyrin repeat protein
VRYVYHKAGKITWFDISDSIDSAGVTPLEQAAQSRYSEVVSVLLDLGGKLTTPVLKAAAGNSESGKEVMALLLDRRGDQITITEDVVKAAAGNYESGKEVMALLDQRSRQKHPPHLL